ncbi:hypothetical protein [Streptomyces sp. NPDC047985]|uniref:hypothetical protein n=1 Tax=Streptomyces sp. NPDC047985 TaxID=3155384 RepID=UPI0034408423
MQQPSRTSGLTALTPDLDISEALRRVVAGQIGPRKPGVVYSTTDGVYEVLDVTTDRTEARRILKSRAAQFAITVHDRAANTIGPIGTAWTGTDRVLKAVA